jgi:retinol dehydrogenase-12
MPRATAQSIATKYAVDASLKKTVIITGASSGIGLAAAVAMAKSGWRVIAAVRNVEKMNKALQQYESSKSGGFANASIESMELDLASFDSVKAFATSLLKREDVPRIDVLLLNAGLGSQWAVTKDGYEVGFQSCHLSHQLLTRLLEEKMIQSAPSRIVIVASHAHKSAPSKYDWPKEETHHKGFHSDSKQGFIVPLQYATSKVANLHFGLVLGKRLQDKGVSVTCLHPGVINSNLWPKWMIGRSLYMLNTEQGAATSVFLSVNPSLSDPKPLVGSYWAPSRFGVPHQEKTTKFGRNEQVAERLWEETEKIIAKYLQ